ncbi:MAG: hypothetical protein RM347_011260 [Nostoc sp. ChiQUE02]|nr:hypothetical protein [Nostoc sp. ChiQUE02]
MKLATLINRAELISVGVALWGSKLRAACRRQAYRREGIAPYPFLP